MKEIIDTLLFFLSAYVVASVLVYLTYLLYKHFRKEEDLLYSTIIKRLSKQNLDFEIDNSNPLHARIVMRELLNRARREVYILSDSFKEEFYKELSEELLNFVKKGKKLKLLMINELPSNLILEKLCEESSNNVEVRVATEEGKEFLWEKDNSKYLNFFLDDYSGVRWEREENIRNGITKALVNFGNKKLHDELLERFQEVFNNDKLSKRINFI